MVPICLWTVGGQERAGLARPVNTIVLVVRDKYRIWGGAFFYFLPKVVLRCYMVAWVNVRDLHLCRILDTPLCIFCAQSLHISSSQLSDV